MQPKLRFLSLSLSRSDFLSCLSAPRRKKSCLQGCPFHSILRECSYPSFIFLVFLCRHVSRRRDVSSSAHLTAGTYLNNIRLIDIAVVCPGQYTQSNAIADFACGSGKFHSRSDPTRLEKSLTVFNSKSDWVRTVLTTLVL